MNTVQILLTCPNCGGSNWVVVSDGFRCAACEAIELPENLSSKITTGGNAEYFGEVRWCEEDLISALKDRGYPTTEANIAKLHRLVSSHWLADHMIEAGWDYIYGQIDSDFGPGDMEESK